MRVRLARPSDLPRVFTGELRRESALIFLEAHAFFDALGLRRTMLEMTAELTAARAAGDAGP